MVQRPAWHHLLRHWVPSEPGNHQRKRFLHQLTIPIVSRVLDHLLDNHPQPVLPPSLDIQPMTIPEDRLWKDLDKLLIFKELIPRHLVLRRVTHLSGA